MSLYQNAMKSDYIVRENGDLEVRDAVMIWKNFEGRINQFGSDKRTFALVLTHEIADILSADGWNVKIRPGKEPEDDPLITTEIVVNMDSQYPPRIELYSDFNGTRSRNLLDYTTVKNLDDMEFESCDLIIHPYEHNRGVYRKKGYLSKMSVIQKNDYDDFGGKYSEWMNGPVEDDELPF